MDYQPLIDLDAQNLDLVVSITEIRPCPKSPRGSGTLVVTFLIGTEDWEGGVAGSFPTQVKELIVTPEMIDAHPLTMNNDNQRLASIYRCVRRAARNFLLLGRY